MSTVKEFVMTLKAGGDLQHLVKSPPGNGNTVLEAAEALERYDWFKSMFLSYDYKECSELSITMKPHLQQLNPMFVRNFIEVIVDGVCDKYCGSVDLLYEISPHGLLHWHGIIHGFGVDILRELKTHLSKFIGRTELKMIIHYEDYVEYILKRYTKEFKNYNKGIKEKYDVTIEYVDE